MLPNFLIVGAMRAGTSTLFAYLAAHPQGFMPRVKELNFFVEGGNWSRGIEWYGSQFEAAGDALAVGEASPSYSMHPHKPGVPSRIAGVVPDVRLIYLVRDPITRLRSHYLHHARRGAIGVPIETAIEQEPELLDTSRYGLQLDRYLEHFDRSQIHVEVAEELWSDPRPRLASICRFLGLDSWWRPDWHRERRIHNTERGRYVHPLVGRFRETRPGRAVARLLPQGVKRAVRRSSVTTSDPSVHIARAEISPELRARLGEELAPDVRRLAGLLDRPFDGWGLT